MIFLFYLDNRVLQDVSEAIKNLTNKLESFESNFSDAINNIEKRLLTIEKSNDTQEADLKAMNRLAHKIKRTTDNLSSSMGVRNKAQEILILDRNYIKATNRRLKAADTEIRNILVNIINICL